jgi:hypothetical protein
VLRFFSASALVCLALWFFPKAGAADGDLGLVVGNLVFVDSNQNDLADTNEGLGGVKVQLFRTGDDPASTTPLGMAVTDSDGFYLIHGLAEGDYFLHLPASEFVSSGKLLRHRPLSNLTPGDDDLGQDGVLSGNPDMHGVSSMVFHLAGGTQPTETGFQAAADDAADGDGNLTLDFGFSLPPLAVGNLVFFDRNGNGRADDEEGVPGVRVELFKEGETTALAVQNTAQNGHFLFDQLLPGRYYLRVPATEFAPGKPLYSMKSLPGVMTGDDDTSEDGEDASEPEVTGLQCAVFSLAPGEAPTGENGMEQVWDDPRDSDVDLTRDFGLMDHTNLPATYEQWRAANSLPNADGDADSDGLSDRVEYALLGPPQSGVKAGLLHLVEGQGGGNWGLRFKRRRGSPTDVIYTVQVSTDARPSAPWQTVTRPPSIVIGDDGSERVTYEQLSEESGVSGHSFGFCRLLVEVDGELEPVIPTLGWHRRRLVLNHNSIGSPFAPEPLFTGLVSGVSSSAVQLTESLNGLFERGDEYYLEALTGSLAGHRWKVDEDASEDTTLALLPNHSFSTQPGTPETLLGAQVCIRPLQTLREKLPVARYYASRNPATADTATFYAPSTASWQSYWLYAAPEGSRWVSTNDADLMDAGGRMLEPTEGMLVRCRGIAASHIEAGEVRQGKFAVPLKQGRNWVASPWCVEDSPLSRGMTQASGFVSSANPLYADRILVWNGDLGTVPAGYDSYFYAKIGGRAWWTSSSDASLADLSSASLFKPGACTFIQVTTPRADWVLVSPLWSE